MNLRERERGYGTKKEKKEIRKSIIACDNDIVKLRSQAEKSFEEIIKNQKCTQKRFESECDKYEIKRQKKKIKLENMSCLIQNVKLVERYVGRMSDRVSAIVIMLTVIDY